MKLCLNMIVKNEAARIERALASCVEFIDAAVIVDTGSTDDTEQVIKDFFETHCISYSITRSPFLDWSQARNAALTASRDFRACQKFDYILLMDADMELVVKDAVAFLADRDGASYDMYQHGGAVHYQNRRLVSARSTGRYLGVTHEYLDVPSAGCLPESMAYFVDHADGSNRPDKFKRDIKLLLAGIKAEPNNARYFFYLAQSYRDAGMPEKAVMWYQRRVAAGGWDEEVWNAQLNMAHAYRDMGNEAEFIRNLLIAYNMRPSRAESLYDLAHFYREKGMNAVGAMIAEQGMAIPPSTDALFVNDFVYTSGLKEEYSIMAFYQPETREKGFKVTNRLALARTPYGGACELARDNLYHYIKPLAEYCPSFTAKQIPFTPPDGWTAMNPCVTRLRNTCVVNVRTVNYRIDERGRYLIKDVADDGVCGCNANDSNPINTRNYLLHLAHDPMSQTRPEVSEVLPPGNMPCEFKPVIGFEDMRIFEHQDRLWSSSTVRQLHWDGNCEQVLARLDGPTSRLTDMHRMLRQPRETQKNWAPICSREQAQPHFMWRPGEVVDSNGNTITKHDTGLATGHISGGSQLIPFADDWLALVHEARHIPGQGVRYYSHRFAVYGKDFRLLKLSIPFVFHDKGIEFAAGLCRHPNNEDLVLSYGVRDAEARIATIRAEEVSTLLWYHSR